jgi:hypothetical protein
MQKEPQVITRFGLDLQVLQFKTYVAHFTASPQKCIERRQLKIMHRAIFQIVLCMRSALPFDAGLSASVCWRAIPLCSQNRSMLCIRLYHRSATLARGNRNGAQNGQQI